MTQSYHAHPLTIFFNLTRVVYLILIPVMRGFVGALRGDFAAWLRGAWIDILIMLLMVLIAVWRWWRITYAFDGRGISITSGSYYRRYTRISWNKVTTISVIRPLSLSLFHAVRLRADTLGGSFKDADFSILLTPKRAEAILCLLREPRLPDSPKDYVPPTRSILALALLTSNSFAGVVFIATFISQAGKLLGNEFSQRLIGTVEEAARTFSFGFISPAAAVLALLLLAGWLIAFVRVFVRYKNMSVSRRRNTYSIRGGVLTHREYSIASGDVNFADITQSLFTKILRLYSLYISAVGYGKQKDDISCIIPTENETRFGHYLETLFPGLRPSPRQFAPPRTGFMRFLAQPLVPCLAIPLAMGILLYLFPDWTSFILFVCLMSMLPSLIFLLVRFFDFRTGGLSFDGKNYTMRYSKGISLHTVVVPADRIVLIELRQSIWQRFGDNCDLYISTMAEERSVHLCRNLRAKELRGLFHLN